MNLATISAIADELAEVLTGRRFGRIFSLSKLSVAIDLRLPGSLYLFVSVEPAAPRMYLIERRLKEVERASVHLSPFALLVRKRLSGARVTLVRQVANERVVAIDLEGVSESGEQTKNGFIAQLTGRSANLFLLDAGGKIVDRPRATNGPGQQVGDEYRPPERMGPPSERQNAEPQAAGPGPISGQLDLFYLEREEKARIHSLASTARARLKQESARKRRLLDRMRTDLAEHGEAEHWKRLGDLLLANVANAIREGGKVTVTDYFSDDASEVVIEIDEEDSITGAAEKFFRRYTRARNAVGEIEGRIKATQEELDTLERHGAELEYAITSGDEEFLRQASGAATQKSSARGASTAPTGTRKFISSDGMEILVGKKSTDNDQLTFRIAKSLDLWMHAADYPGSHVVVRNPNRKEIPQRTLLEAAQLAAFYSRGKSQVKAAVHYTQKKFVNKPRGAAPGLVSLAKFKTVLVEPKVPEGVVLV